MTPDETKTDVLYLRVEPTIKQKLGEMAALSPGQPTASGLVRWLVLAFIEGRVVVTPPTIKEN